MKRQILDSVFWNAKRQIVKNSYDYSEHWKEVIERFKTRIEDFYFSPIDRVKEPNELKGEGFTILTMQCTLIEMFAAFKYGKIYKFNKRENDPDYIYKKADECFISFLYSEAIFENHFFKWDDGKKLHDQPFSAIEFYRNIRCGLIHEARTKGKWVINAKKTYKNDEDVYITRDTINEKIRVDRTILNKQLKKYFQDYICYLSQTTPEGNSLRRLFARKLDDLYEIQEDKSYDWWNE